MRAAKISPSSNGAFLAPFCWLKYKKPVGSDAHYTANNAIQKKNNPLKPFTCCLIRKRTMNINLMRSGTWNPTCFPKYTLDYHKQKRLQKHKNCSDEPVTFPHNLKASLFFFPLWLLIHLFVDLYFIASGAEGMCLMCSPGSLQKGKEGCCCIQVKGRRRRHVCWFAAAL